MDIILSEHTFNSYAVRHLMRENEQKRKPRPREVIIDSKKLYYTIQ